eukprot:728796-Amphidinium_carterae.1
MDCLRPHLHQQVSEKRFPKAWDPSPAKAESWAHTEYASPASGKFTGNGMKHSCKITLAQTTYHKNSFL